MQRGWWNKPVSIRAAGITTHVTNTKQAAHMLVDEDWGWDDNTRHAAAMACVAALRGGDDEEAREAFEAAVKGRSGG